MKKFKKKLLKKIDKCMKTVDYGSIAFGIGMLVVLISAGVFSYGVDLGMTGVKVLSGVLIILGLIVGCLNITKNETVSFLVAAMALVSLAGFFMGNLIQTFEMGQTTANFIGQLFKNIIMLVVPASIVVSLKTLFISSKDEK